MTHQPPNPRSPRHPEDEWVAAIVAFAVLGTVVVWGLSRAGGGFDWSSLARISGTSSLESPEPPETEEPAGIGGFLGENNEPTGSASVPDEVVTPADADDRLTERPLRSGRRLSPFLLPFLLNQTSDAPGASPSPEVEVPVTPDSPPQPPATEPPIAAVPSPTPATEPPATAPAEASPSPLPIERPEGVSFADVPTGYWALPFVTALAQRGVVSGFEDGTFQPDQLLTRAQYAAQVQQIVDQTRQEAIAFTDVPADYWATEAIDTAVKTGFLKGYPNRVFRPDDPIPRFQVLLSLVNGFDLAPPANPARVVSRYQDADQIPDYAVPAIAAATQAGIVVNYPNRDILDPTRPATRAEVAAMLYQALAETNRVEEAIDSPYIVRP